MIFVWLFVVVNVLQTYKDFLKPAPFWYGNFANHVVFTIFVIETSFLYYENTFFDVSGSLDCHQL